MLLQQVIVPVVAVLEVPGEVNMFLHLDCRLEGSWGFGSDVGVRVRIRAAGGLRHVL